MSSSPSRSPPCLRFVGVPLVGGFLLFAAPAHADGVAAGTPAAAPSAPVTNGKDGAPVKAPEETSPSGGYADFDVFFLRGSSTRARGGGTNGSSGFGFTLGSELWLTVSQRWFSFHYDYDALIGGGGSGLEGIFATNLTGGVRIPVTSTFGPFARVGIGGAFQGNDWYEYSHFDAPLAQVGASFASAGYAVEAGGQAAYTIGGRYITEVASRRLLDGAPTLGGYAQIQLRPVVLRGEYTDYVQGSTGAHLSAWTTRGCVVFPSVKPPTASPVDVCFDGTWLSGGVVPPGAITAETSSVYYFGVSIGVGVTAASDHFTDALPKTEPVKPLPAAVEPSPRTEAAPRTDAR